MLKRCGGCKRELPLSAFHRDRSGGGKYGRQGRCRACMKIRMAEYHQATRMRVLSHYSGGSMRCACCGEHELEFLGIDHVHRDGAQHRREVRPSAIYRWLITHKFPPGIQVLCHNCNLARGYYGACPHQDLGSDGRDGAVMPDSLEQGGPISAAATMLGQAWDRHWASNRPGDATQCAHRIEHDVASPARLAPVRPDRRHAAAVALAKLGASKGGHARAATLSAAERRAIAKKASAARWTKRKEVHHEKP